MKMSTLDDLYILTIIRSEFTGQVIIRHFDDEHIAAQFVDFVCELDSDQEQDI